MRFRRGALGRVVGQAARWSGTHFIWNTRRSGAAARCRRRSRRAGEPGISLTFSLTLFPTLFLTLS